MNKRGLTWQVLILALIALAVLALAIYWIYLANTKGISLLQAIIDTFRFGR